MAKIIVLGERTHVRALLSESLWHEGHQVECVGDADLFWELLSNMQPDLVLLDAHSDGFGALELFLDIKQKFADLSVIVYVCRNHDDAPGIKGAIADTPGRETAYR